MNKTVTFAAVIALLVTGCSGATDGKNDYQSSHAFDYICEDGKKLSVMYYPADEQEQRIRVRFKDGQFDLQRIPSGSGDKYSNGRYTWWSKGSSGFLEIDHTIVMRECSSKDAE